MSERTEKMTADKAKRRRVAEPDIEELIPEHDHARNLNEAITAVATPGNPNLHTPSTVLQLQRTIGNRATQQLLDEQMVTRDLISQHTPRTPSSQSQPTFSSPALQLRQQIQNAPNAPMLLQRAVKTWAGEWDTDKYDTVKLRDVRGGAAYAKRHKISPDKPIGVDIVLKFQPGKHVNATKIGTVQTIVSFNKGKLSLPGGDKKTLTDRTIPIGDTHAGTRIDQLAQGGKNHGNPMYATGESAEGDTLGSTATNASWGQHGYHYKKKDGKITKKDATLKDKPTRPMRNEDANQIFETTALALSGEQEGTYYGSVQWGWESDSKGAFTKLPLTLKSNDVPTDAFAAASELWNKSKTPTGKDTINLPIVKGKFANTAGVWLVTNPSQYKKTRTDKLPKNTRVEVTDKGEGEKFNKVTDDKYVWWKVTVVDGAAIGKVGWVMQRFLSDAKTMEKKEPGWFSRVLGFIGGLFGG